MFFASLSAILIGVAIIGQWLVTLIKKKVPGPEAGGEAGRGQIEMAFHYAAEFLTAAVLIVGGLALLGKIEWGSEIYLVAVGMLIYTVINSSGYFAQLCQKSVVAMFSVILIIAVIDLTIVA